MKDNFYQQIASIASTYNTNKIFIIGKGPSIDKIDTRAFDDSFVIALNDAEQIVPADVTIFHEEWAQDGIKSSGYRSKVYVTSTEFEAPKNAIVFKAPYCLPTQSSSELVMQRLLNDDFVIESTLFLSALKIAKKISDIKGTPQTVYMMGFDFNAHEGYSAKIQKDFSESSDLEKSLISQQEYLFLNALYFLKDTGLKILHVGNRLFSNMTPTEFNHGFSKRPQSKSEFRHEVEVVAELTTNHFGDRQRLEKMIRIAAASGANYIKLQKRDVNTFYTQEQLKSAYKSPFGTTFADYRHQLELSLDDFAFVDELCKNLEIKWFASILDQVSFKSMMELKPKFVKLPSTISKKTEYLSYVANNYKENVVISTGMTDSSYEEFILKAFDKCAHLYLLQCNSAYPTPLKDCNIGVVKHYSDLAHNNPKIIPGYSSHDIGWKASALAVAAGAKMIEKHVKLGTTDWAHFDSVAIDLTTPEFKDYVDHIREAEVILGSSTKNINESEHHKY